MSLDMNYRVLAKVEGICIQFHRVVNADRRGLDRQRPAELGGAEKRTPQPEGNCRQVSARLGLVAGGASKAAIPWHWRNPPLPGTPSHLMGYENLFLSYYDQPELIHDILNTFSELWMGIWEEVLGQLEIDMVHFFEDVSMGTGSMISPALFREFMQPCYRRLCSFLRSRRVKVILVDTDGDCTELVPLFLESGITGLYPMETSTGLDICGIRRRYPKLQMLGAQRTHCPGYNEIKTQFYYLLSSKRVILYSVANVTLIWMKVPKIT